MRDDFCIRSLGQCRFVSPLESVGFVDDDEGVLVDATVRKGDGPADDTALEQAGPRGHLFFDASKVRAGIVTCGGLCPGLNDVIRAVTMVLWYRYGVRSILGFRYGYQGITESSSCPPVELTPDIVADIHQHGGTILGSSRGPQESNVMIDCLLHHGVNMLFTVGGDGTQRGALKLVNEAERRKLDISIIGIPKTIDNDLSYTERTFGFETAVAMSQMPITCAHMEAKGAYNGVGLVKLMGRESGFVAARGALASSDVNLVLIPEAPFSLGKVMPFLEDRLKRKSHAVIVVAEGAGQELVPSEGVDASGNRKLGDIGVFLQKAIIRHFAEKKIPVSVKYIDPSYMIRSERASADDSVFCFQLSEYAVHAAMTGRTGMVVGLWNGHFVHVPIEKAVEKRKTIDPLGLFWQSVLDNTGQPRDLA